MTRSCRESASDAAGTGACASASSPARDLYLPSGVDWIQHGRKTVGSANNPPRYELNKFAGPSPSAPSILFAVSVDPAHALYRFFHYCVPVANFLVVLRSREGVAAGSLACVLPLNHRYIHQEPVLAVPPFSHSFFLLISAMCCIF